MPGYTSSNRVVTGKAADNAVPNLYWRALTKEALRAQQRYVALPHVRTLSFSSTADYRYIRQESELWSDLHQGVLTTGKLNAALGFYHPRVSPRLRLPQTDAQALQSICFHLQEQPLPLPKGQAAAGATLQHNEQQRQQYNTQLSPALATPEYETELAEAMRQHSASVALWGTSAVRMAWGSIQEASALYSLMQLFPDSLMEEAGLFQLGGRSAAPTGSSGSSGQASSSIGSSLGSAQAAPSAAGTRGGSSPAPAEVPLPVQLLQLKKPARPAAAAAAAAADHPEAASSWLLEALGLPLPALGASPDGLILHTVRLPLWEVQMALQRATNCRESLTAALQKICSHPSAATRAAYLRAFAREVQVLGNRELAKGMGPRQDLQEAASSATAATHDAATAAQPSSGSSSSSSRRRRKKKGAAAAAAAGGGQAQLAAGTAAAAAGDASFAGTGAGRAGIACFQGDHAEQQAAGPAQQQDVGHSAANSASSTGTTTTSIGLTQVDPLEEQLQQLLRLWQQAAPAASDSTAGAAATAASEAPDTAGDAATGLHLLITLHFREVVEVKNHCPFRFRQQSKGRKGSIKLKYSLSDGGPVAKPLPGWVPQLQMHMLATGCQSVLLVSRTPSAGVRVFRMWRDEGYLRQMLGLVAGLYSSCVLAGSEPEQEFYLGQARYQHFVAKTLALARSAQLVVHHTGDIIAPGAPSNAFL